jgi:hypothetical protein
VSGGVVEWLSGACPERGRGAWLLQAFGLLGLRPQICGKAPPFPGLWPLIHARRVYRTALATAEGIF